MRAHLCDFCRKEVDPLNTRFKLDGKDYRFEIVSPDHSYGVRWKRIDFCQDCFIKALEALLDKGKDSTSCAKGENRPALDTAEICHTAPNSAMLQGLKPHAKRTA